MHNYVDVSFGNVAVAFCEGDGTFSGRLSFMDGSKIVNVEYDEFVEFFYPGCWKTSL